MSDCVEIVYELLLLPNDTAEGTFLHKQRAVGSVERIFIVGELTRRRLGEYLTLNKQF
jgi:hypothetical protein